MKNFKQYLNISILVWCTLTLASQAWSAPGFELDLKELKKPSPPPVATKKKPATTVKKKQTAHVTKANKPQPQTVPSGTLAPVEPSELTLKAGEACPLAERLAVAIARSVPAETLLNGLDLRPLAAVSYGNLSVLITCGIPLAEAYTYRRLLEEHAVQLVNFRGNEQAEQVAGTLIDALALSYRLETDESSPAADLVYYFPADQERERPFRLTLQP
jgi:hypothetical protein